MTEVRYRCTLCRDEVSVKAPILVSLIVEGLHKEARKREEPENDFVGLVCGECLLLTEALETP